MIYRKIIAIFGVVLALLLLTGANLMILATPEQVELRLRQEFSKYFYGDIEFESCRLDLFRGLEVTNLELRDRRGGEVLLKVNRARFEHKLTSLILGWIDLSNIYIDATVYLDRRDGAIKWLKIPREAYYDPRHPGRKVQFLRFDHLETRLKILVRDNFVFKDDEVQEFTGQIQMDRNPFNRIQHNVNGFLLGDFWGYWDIEGTADFYRDRDSAIHLVNRTFPLNHQLQNKLTEDMQAQFEVLRPRGLARMDFFATGRLSDLERSLDYGLSIEPTGMEVTFFKFPYTLQRIYGKILCSRDHIEIRNLNGVNGTTHFTMNGKIDGYSKSAAALFTIDAADVVLDEQFYLALNEEARKVWDVYNPSGLVDLKATFDKAPGEHVEAVATYDVQLKNARFFYTQFPYPLENATGRMTLREEHIAIHSLAVKRNEGVLEVYDTEAWQDHATRQIFVNLKIRGKNILVDDEFVGAFPPQYQKIWRSFAPSGRINFDAAVSLSPDKETPEYIIRLQPTSLDFSYDIFPYPLKEVTGSIELLPKRTVIHDIKGWHGQTQVSLDGAVQYPDPDHLDVKLDIRFADLIFDETFAAALNPALRAGLEKIKPAGAFNLDAAIHHVSQTGDPDRMEFSGNLEFKDAAFQAGVQMSRVTGAAAARGELLYPDRVSLNGNLNLTGLEIVGKKFQEFSADFSYRDRNLEITGIRGKNFGGDLDGKAYVHLAKNEADVFYSGHLDILGMNMGFLSDELLRDNPQGNIDIRVGFGGQGGSQKNLVGTGQIKMKEARLWNAPFVLSLVRLLTLNVGGGAFHKSEINFIIEQETFKITDMEFRSPELDLRGRGEMTFEGKLDMSLQASFVPKFARRIPLIGALMHVVVDGVARQAFAVEVKGTIDAPKPRLAVLPLISNPLRFIFGGDDPPVPENEKSSGN